MSDGEERWRSLLRGSSPFVFVLDRLDRIRFANRPFPGYRANELVIASYWRHVPPEEHERQRLVFAHVRATGQPSVHDGTLLGPAGQRARWRAHCLPLWHGGSRAEREAAHVLVVGTAVEPGEEHVRIVRDHAAQQHAWAVEERDRFFQLSLDMLCVVGFDGYFKRLSPSWTATLGWTNEELMAQPYAAFVHPDDREATLAEAAKLREGAPIRCFENRYRCKDGSYRWLLWNAAPCEELGLVYAAARDLTEQRRAEEEARRDSEQRYRALFHNSPLPMFVFCEKALAFLAVNDVAVHHYGYTREEFLRMTLVDVVAAEDTHRLLEAARTGQIYAPGAWRHRKRDGMLIDVEVSAQPLMFDGHRATIAVVKDVTERARLERQLLEAQKMEAVGRLAGGVAHDFNNILAVILMDAEEALAKLDQSPVASEVRNIRDAALRAAALTQQLLAFSRRQILQPSVLDLNEVVADLHKMVSRIIGEDVVLTTRCAPDLGRIKADRAQLEQVIMNLVVNARDAMPGGGTVTIETENVTLDEEGADRLGAGVPAGRYVVLTVSDRGHGMDATTMARIFEPFFTTKEQGKGTGLGLSTVFGIVRQSGGSITVDSSPGEGSTFRVYLPRVDDAIPAVPASRPVVAPDHKGTILLVEDDDQVRAAIRRVLLASGYTLLEARSGEEALALLDESGPVDLVIADLVLPGMDGASLAKEVEARKASVRALVMSGFTEHAMPKDRATDGGTSFLHKPFSADTLVRSVRAVLEASPSS